MYNPKYVGHRRYKHVFNYSVWVQLWCINKARNMRHKLLYGRILPKECGGERIQERKEKNIYFL